MKLSRTILASLVLGLFAYLCPPWLLGSGSAQADPRTLKWANTAASTAKNGIYRGDTCAALVKIVTIPVATTYVDSTAGAGPYCYAVTSILADGSESTLSNTGVYVPPPSGLTVAGIVPGFDSAVAFRVLANGSRSATVAGLVKVGTRCTGAALFTYRGKTYRRVDPASVGWWATARTPDVAAPCNG